MSSFWVYILNLHKESCMMNRIWRYTRDWFCSRINHASIIKGDIKHSTRNRFHQVAPSCLGRLLYTRSYLCDKFKNVIDKAVNPHQRKIYPEPRNHSHEYNEKCDDKPQNAWFCQKSMWRYHICTDHINHGHKYRQSYKHGKCHQVNRKYWRQYSNHRQYSQKYKCHKWSNPRKKHTHRGQLYWM